MDLADLIKNTKPNKKENESVPAEYFNAPNQKSIKEKAKTTPKQKESGIGKILGLFGMQGTGKSYRACCFSKIGKVLYLDGERKVHEVINEKFIDEKDDIEIDVFQMLKPNYMIDELKTVVQFLKKLPSYIKKIESGNYATIVVDNCSIFRTYAKQKWLSDNPKRTRPQSFEYGEIEKIVQQCIMPIINACKINNVNLILCYGITDFYIKDIVMGTKEDAKLWLLGQLTYELWLERDYKIYCLKHPYRPYWQYNDQDLNIVDYLFDNDFIENEVEFKEYVEFKEQTLTSSNARKELTEMRNKNKLSLG
jgi:hypothetical protein